MDEMEKNMTKKYLGHAFVILLMCSKEGVEEFIDGCIVNSARCWMLHGYLLIRRILEQRLGASETTFKEIVRHHSMDVISIQGLIPRFF